MNILITGGAGFIGSNLAEKLLYKNHNLTIFDNFEHGNIKNLSKLKKRLKIVQGDIRDKKLINEVMPEIEAVFHFAAKISVTDSFKNKKEFENINFGGTLNLLNYAKKYRINKFILASSAAVYGNNQELPICETQKPNPLSPLGETKLNAEKLCHTFRKNGLETLVLRFFNVYGPRQKNDQDNVIPNFINSLAKTEIPTIYGTGLHTRDFLYIDDLTDACVSSLIKKTPPILNIGTGKEVSIQSLFNTVSKLMGNKKIANYQNPRKGDLDRSYACICQAKKYLNFKPKTQLETGLSKTIPWYLQK